VATLNDFTSARAKSSQLSRCRSRLDHPRGTQRAERWVGFVNRSLLEYYITSFARSKGLSREDKSSLGVLRRMAKKK
jgi:hypothetical protein